MTPYRSQAHLVAQCAFISGVGDHLGVKAKSGRVYPAIFGAARNALRAVCEVSKSEGVGQEWHVDDNPQAEGKTRAQRDARFLKDRKPVRNWRHEWKACRRAYSDAERSTDTVPARSY